jgi:hypothetical protein
MDPANAEAIERTLKLAASQQIPVFWVLFPLPDKLQSLRDQRGAESKHEHFVRSVAARYRGTVTVLDSRRSGYPDQFFADATHLNRHGAIALSRAVGTAIAELDAMPGPPARKPYWIVLNRANERSDGGADPVEDIEESKRILNPDLLTRTLMMTGKP